MLALLAMLVLGVPGAHGVSSGSAEYRFTSLDRLEVDLEATFSGDESRSQRSIMDADGDGAVSREEALASRDATLGNVRSLSSGIGLPTGRLLVDGGQSTSAEVDLSYAGAEGSVGREEALVMSWDLVLHFDVAANQTHLVEMDTLNFSRAGHIQMEVVTLLLAVPPGWEVAASGGLPLHATSDGERVSFPAGLAGTNRVTLVLAPQPETRGTPDAGVAVLVAMVLAVAGRRRLG